MNTFMENLVNEYLLKIVGTLLMMLFSYIGTICGKAFKKYIDTKTKKDIVKIVVQSVEQAYKTLHGEDKFNEALKSASALMTEKGLKFTDTELRTLIEGAVGEFNKAFENTTK